MARVLKLFIFIVLSGCTAPSGPAVSPLASPSAPPSVLPNPGSFFHFESTNFKIFDQPLKPDGNIIIDTVFMDRPGFIVLLSDNNYIPGEAIGVSNLLEINKEIRQLAVKADPARAGNRVHVTVAFDNGDGIFNFEKDEFLRDAGNVILTDFITFRKI